MVNWTSILVLAMMFLAAPSAWAATPLTSPDVAACKAPRTEEMMELRVSMWRARVDLPVVALAVFERNGTETGGQWSYLPLGVALLDRVDPRLGHTWHRIDRATILQMLPVNDEQRVLIVTEYRFRIVDMALVKFSDLEPGELRLGFATRNPPIRAPSLALCVVEIPAWSGDEYMPKAR